MFLPLLAIAAEAGREWYDRALNAIREHTRRMADEKLDVPMSGYSATLAVFERNRRKHDSDRHCERIEPGRV
jgi:hypothetical protein